jgi:hypothetical protein
MFFGFCHAMCQINLKTRLILLGKKIINFYANNIQWKIECWANWWTRLILFFTFFFWSINFFLLESDTNSMESNKSYSCLSTFYEWRVKPEICWYRSYLFIFFTLLCVACSPFIPSIFLCIFLFEFFLYSLYLYFSPFYLYNIYLTFNKKFQ